MNIKQAELQSGVSKRNIRFYEQKGLIEPNRNQENEYREYTPEDIQRLKMIRMLRMVDMPIEQIRDILTGKSTLDAAAAAHKARLTDQAKQLETAIRFCEEFEAAGTVMNIDETLARMENPAVKQGLFAQWIADYRIFAQAQQKKTFTFVPDTAVTNPGEFTLALCQYASENDLNLVITREGMYPEFTIDAEPYSAERIYTAFGRVPTAVIRCSALHPEHFDQPQPKWKRVVFSFAHYGWIVLLFLLVSSLVLFPADWTEAPQSWEGWLAILVSIALAIIDLYRWLLLHYNERHG